MRELDANSHEQELTEADTRLDGSVVLEVGSQLRVPMTLEQADGVAQLFNQQEQETGEPAANLLLEHLQQSA